MLGMVTLYNEGMENGSLNPPIITGTEWAIMRDENGVQRVRVLARWGLYAWVDDGRRPFTVSIACLTAEDDRVTLNWGQK